MIERQNGTSEDIITLITTFADAETARQIGTQLVESQLVACVNVLPGVESIFRWQGEVQLDAEAIALIKTTRGRLEELEAWLQTYHPYEVPEILVLTPESGSARYLQWVRESVGSGGETALDKARS
ncbi:MAG: divalent-cation tolerance protein CutA [Verrucomicrobiales bacterium]|jgi:periplasmic divalent cation tolerance protein|nr:divalent-cation tolerance protein CutA [Verrucomicrobiales bacterium]MDP4638812.1 divalent-cation tolerance protein CutA [Verrucomicrobiales bacterium]MDP4791169.1 divalent-cation tolerance protein CutA [Verrucomicrobiales bacterium]MDP4849813.1 divalent-cation tolerance protein CutA [Verrucomicrobiales bacterium]MDP4938605.1 divalent-cation tolerance protein CutA [Verrucomicrobiales bacterium]